MKSKTLMMLEAFCRVLAGSGQGPRGFEKVRKAMTSANAVVLTTLITFGLMLPVFSGGLRSALAEPVKLPEPKHDGKAAVEKALFERRSR